jgi:hypothetical protein
MSTENTAGAHRTGTVADVAVAETGVSGHGGDATSTREESVGQLLGELSADMSTLVRQEVALAQAELSQKAKSAGKGAGMLAGAAVVGLAVLGALTAFLIIVIDLAAPTWLAALVVTVVWVLVMVGLALAGRAALKRALPAKPEQTVETVKEDVAWAKNQAKSVRK